MVAWLTLGGFWMEKMVWGKILGTSRVNKTKFSMAKKKIWVIVQKFIGKNKSMLVIKRSTTSAAIWLMAYDTQANDYYMF